MKCLLLFVLVVSLSGCSAIDSGRSANDYENQIESLLSNGDRLENFNKVDCPNKRSVQVAEEAHFAETTDIENAFFLYQCAVRSAQLGDDDSNLALLLLSIFDYSQLNMERSAKINKYLIEDSEPSNTIKLIAQLHQSLKKSDLKDIDMHAVLALPLQQYESIELVILNSLIRDAWMSYERGELTQRQDSINSYRARYKAPMGKTLGVKLGILDVLLSISKGDVSQKGEILNRLDSVAKELIGAPRDLIVNTTFLISIAVLQHQHGDRAQVSQLLALTSHNLSRLTVRQLAGLSQVNIKLIIFAGSRGFNNEVLSLWADAFRRNLDYKRISESQKLSVLTTVLLAATAVRQFEIAQDILNRAEPKLIEVSVNELLSFNIAEINFLEQSDLKREALRKSKSCTETELNNISDLSALAKLHWCNAKTIQLMYELCSDPELAETHFESSMKIAQAVGNRAVNEISELIDSMTQRVESCER